MPAAPQAQKQDHPLAPGQLLADRFRVVRRIAQGGMGVVYEAYDEKLDRRIALKCARRGHGRHLSPEVRLATEISHPNICKIYEIHTTQTPAGPLEFFTMEFLDGETLTCRLRAGRMPADESLTIARQICAGLAEAHRHGIVHGDLKSGNVILTSAGNGGSRAVITDFGLARAASSTTASGSGSPGYMAPELYGGAPTSVASDIYALGVILHELACGLRPDELAAMKATTVALQPSSTSAPAHSTMPSSEIAAVPSRWKNVIRTCLQPDPARRYESVDDILAALEPSTVRRKLLIGSAALALAAIAAYITYLRSTAPAQTINVEIAQFQTPSNSGVDGSQLRQEIVKTVSLLKSTRAIGFAVVNGSAATHRLSADLNATASGMTVHAALTDLRSGAPVTEWSANYSRDQLRYAPVAFAGIVSRSFHLPALTAYATVNEKAAVAYTEGVRLLKDDSKIDEAIGLLQKAALFDQDSALPLAGIAEGQRRKYFLTDVRSWLEQAKSSVEQAELRNPDCGEVHRIAGLIEFDYNRTEQAIARMRRATEFQPPSVDAFRRLGAMYSKNDQLPEALQAFKECQRIDPTDSRVYQELAHVYRKQSKLPEAAKALEAGIAIAPDRPVLRTSLASCYMDQGRFVDAEAELRTVWNKTKSPEALVVLGQVLMYQRKDGEAIPLLEEARRRDPNHQFARMYAGLAYAHTGRAAEATRVFREGLAVAEQQLIALPKDGYQHAVVAYFCALNSQPARAALEAAQALQLMPHHSDTLWLTALAYERAGDRTAAVKTLEAAPRALLEDLKRWPEATSLSTDRRFSQLLASTR